jgi:hypothetical protein
MTTKLDRALKRKETYKAQAQQAEPTSAPAQE